MEFVRPYPPLEGGYATILHFAWGAGLTTDSLRSRISDGTLPPMPESIGRAGGKAVFAEYEVHKWIDSIQAWKENLPAMRAKERAEAAARQQWLRDLERAKEKAQSDWSAEQQAMTRERRYAERQEEMARINGSTYRS